MNIFCDSEEENNNPFAGTDHLYASGIAGIPDLKPREDLEKDKIIGSGSRKKFSCLLEEQRDDEDICDDIHKSMDEDYRTQIGEPNLESGSSSEEVNHFSNSITSNIPNFEPYVSLSMSMINSPMSSESNASIRINNAGDYKDPWGKHAIGYDIHFNEKDVIRRYSEFDTLRQALVRLLPTIIIPHIPSKHPIIKYFLNPLNVENDKKMISKRKRMLQTFLNHCYNISEIREHIVFKKFINPEYIWKDVLTSPPISIIPANNLQAPPLNPTKPSPLHLLLPTLVSISKVDLMQYKSDEDSVNMENEFTKLGSIFEKYKLYLQTLHTLASHNRSQFKSMSKLLAELGAYFNALSLEVTVINDDSFTNISRALSINIEKIGHAFDVSYISSDIFTENILAMLEEPVEQMLQLLEDAERVLRFRDLKRSQFQIIESTITKRENRIKILEDTEEQMKRLEHVLQRNAQESPTIASVIRNKNIPLSVDVSWGEDSTSEEIENQQNSKYKKSLGKRKYKNSIKTGHIEPHLLSETERYDEVQKLKREIEKLRDCYKLIIKDMKELNNSSLKSLKDLSSYLDSTWVLVLKSLTQSIIRWLQESLKAWIITKVSNQYLDNSK